MPETDGVGGLEAPAGLQLLGGGGGLVGVDVEQVDGEGAGLGKLQDAGVALQVLALVADVGGRERHLGGRAGARQGAGGFAHAQFGGQVPHEVDALGGLELRGQGLRRGADALGANDEVGIGDRPGARGRMPGQAWPAAAGKLLQPYERLHQHDLGHTRGEVHFVGQAQQPGGPAGRGAGLAGQTHSQHAADHAPFALHVRPACSERGPVGQAAEQVLVQVLQPVGVGGVHMQLQAGRCGGHVPGAEQFWMVEGLALALLAQQGVVAE